MNSRRPVLPINVANLRIRTIRGQRVILDGDLAAVYGVTTKRLNEQVRRNARKFPDDFVFQLTPAEHANLRSQIATSRARHGGRRYRPQAFTENGAVMAANVLNSPQAVRMSVFVVRAFNRMRQLLAGSPRLATELKRLEQRLAARIELHDSAIRDLLRRTKQILALLDGMAPPDKEMGFHTTMAKPAARATGQLRP